MHKPGGQFTKFLAVGSIGFAVDASLLYTLVSLGGDAYAMRLVSFIVAVCVTWVLNRSWTFKGRKTHSPQREYAAYAAVQGFGGALNFVVYTVVLSMIGVEPTRALIALSIASLVALLFNYFGAKYAVFRSASL